VKSGFGAGIFWPDRFAPASQRRHELAKMPQYSLDVSMSSFLDERATWLGRHVLPHEPALRAWLSRRRHDGLEIDDIIQETYTRLIAAESVSHVLDAKSYAFQTAGSVVIDHLRRMKVVSIASVPGFDYLEVVSDDPSPERQTIDRDELHRLAQAIAGLPPKVREVFTLRRVYGLSQREVAVKMGISESTVEKHMSRGFLIMLERMGHGGNGSSQPSNSGSGKFGIHRLHAGKDRTPD
jgi:RNA polymerase sigma factor (sigma-70 family)